MNLVEREALSDKVLEWADRTFREWYPDLTPTDQDRDTLACALLVCSAMGKPFEELSQESLTSLLETLTAFRGRAEARALQTLSVDTSGLH